MKNLVLMLLAVLCGSVTAGEISEECRRIGERIEGKSVPFHPPLGGTVSSPGRSHFYWVPDSRCEAKAFLVKGDSVVIYEDYGEWFYVWYKHPITGVDTEGWFPKNRIKEGGTMGMTSE